MKFSYLVLPCVLFSWICLLVGQRERGFAEVADYFEIFTCFFNPRNILKHLFQVVTNAIFEHFQTNLPQVATGFFATFTLLYSIFFLYIVLYPTVSITIHYQGSIHYHTRRSLAGSAPFVAKESQTTLFTTLSAASKVAVLLLSTKRRYASFSTGRYHHEERMMSDLRSRSSRYEETPIDKKGKSNVNDQVD